ncbi:MAG: class I SAM-dependent methyltransferase, partial [Bacteroidota bacterium]
MNEVSAYPTHWLETRFPFDAEGRHPVLESQMITYLQGISKPHILDVGAGYGANYRYFAPKLSGQEQWSLLEHDPILIEAMRQDLPDSIQYLQHSLLDIPGAIDPDDLDLVMANAVFDLFSRDQFYGFAERLAAANTPLYLSLNYTGMGFVPENKYDEEMIAHYEAHMQRPQDFGTAMGADGPRQMKEILTELDYQVQMAPSYWHIGAENERMQSY